MSISALASPVVRFGFGLARAVRAVRVVVAIPPPPHAAVSAHANLPEPTCRDGESSSEKASTAEPFAVPADVLVAGGSRAGVKLAGRPPAPHPPGRVRCAAPALLSAADRYRSMRFGSGGPA